MRELTVSSTQTARVAANDSTYLIVQDHVVVIGCAVCGGVKNHLTLPLADWTEQQVRLWDDYYQHLAPCLCNVDASQAQAMAEDIRNLEKQNLRLELEKLELERTLETRNRIAAAQEEAHGHNQGE